MDRATAYAMLVEAATQQMIMAPQTPALAR